jgi:ABC-type uncharacterized transport system permease subunit
MKETMLRPVDSGFIGVGKHVKVFLGRRAVMMPIIKRPLLMISKAVIVYFFKENHPFKTALSSCKIIMDFFAEFPFSCKPFFKIGDHVPKQENNVKPSYQSH